MRWNFAQNIANYKKSFRAPEEQPGLVSIALNLASLAQKH